MSENPPKKVMTPLQRAVQFLFGCYQEGHTPTTLSKATGLSRTSLWRLETGKLRPRQVTVCVLRYAYRAAAAYNRSKRPEVQE